MTDNPRLVWQGGIRAVPLEPYLGDLPLDSHLRSLDDDRPPRLPRRLLCGGALARNARASTPWRRCGEALLLNLIEWSRQLVCRAHVYTNTFWHCLTQLIK